MTTNLAPAIGKRCAATGIYDGTFQGYSCGKSAKYRENSRDWCVLHLPSNVKLRRIALNAKYDAENAAWREKNRRETALRVACEGLSTDALESGVVKDALDACEKVRKWLLDNGPLVDDGITHPLFIKANNAVDAVLRRAGRLP